MGEKLLTKIKREGGVPGGECRTTVSGFEGIVGRGLRGFPNLIIVSPDETTTWGMVKKLETDTGGKLGGGQGSGGWSDIKGGLGNPWKLLTSLLKWEVQDS